MLRSIEQCVSYKVISQSYEIDIFSPYELANSEEFSLKK